MSTAQRTCRIPFGLAHQPSLDVPGLFLAIGLQQFIHDVRVDALAIDQQAIHIKQDGTNHVGGEMSHLVIGGPGPFMAHSLPTLHRVSILKHITVVRRTPTREAAPVVIDDVMVSIVALRGGHASKIRKNAPIARFFCRWLGPRDRLVPRLRALAW